MPTNLGEVSHRLRHHGKHHQGEIWRAPAVAEVVNTTATPALERATVCYTTNEVLLIIGLTCVLNLAFIAVVMGCIHFCSGSALPKISRLESLILVDNTASDSELEECGRRRRNIHLPSLGRRHHSYQYLRSLPSSLQLGVSLQPLLAITPPSSDGPRYRLDGQGPGSSISMENLLFV